MTEDRSVTFLTEYFYPEEASTAQLLTELTTNLADRFDVSVITGYPSYHDDDRIQSVSRRSRYEGVSVNRVRSTRFDKDALSLRVVNWLSFTLLVALGLLRRRPGDVVVVLSNPPILPFVAWLTKRLCGTPYVFVMYDMYPDMPVELGVLSAKNPLAWAWERAMRAVYCDADRIIVLGESMERRLTRKMADYPGFSPEKIEVIPNWEDGEFIEPISKEDNEFARTHGTVEPFTLLYSGNIGRYHELETAIDAIALLEERGRKDVQLLVIGEGAKKDDLARMVDRRGIENVRFLPFQPLERLPETLTCGDASLVGITPEMEGICVSSKLYSSLAAGRPVLAIVAEGDEVARVVTEADCGVHIEQGSAEHAADVLATWADNPEMVERLGANARECFEQNYTREHAIDAYSDLLSELSGANRPDR